MAVSEIVNTWTVVVPVKGTSLGKSRMAPGLDVAGGVDIGRRVDLGADGDVTLAVGVAAIPRHDSAFALDFQESSAHVGCNARRTSIIPSGRQIVLPPGAG